MALSQTRRLLAGFALTALLSASILVAAQQGAHAATNTGGVVDQTMNAGPYALTLHIGPLEQMYTQAQAKKSHPKRGEVMLRGTMVMGGMDMGAAMPNHHLELHVHNRGTHAVVANAMVTITVETSSGKVLIHVPIAVMRGVTAGTADIHYGNNVSLKDGAYKVVVQVEHTTATFKVTLAKSTMSM